MILRLLGNSAGTSIHSSAVLVSSVARAGSGLRIDCADFKRFLSSLSFSVDIGIYSSSKLGVVPVHTASVGGMDFL